MITITITITISISIAITIMIMIMIMITPKSCGDVFVIWSYVVMKYFLFLLVSCPLLRYHILNWNFSISYNKRHCEFIVCIPK